MARKRPASSDETTGERYAELMTLGKSSFVSQSGIAALLKQVSKKGKLPESFSRSSQYRARKAVCGTMTDYGPIVETKTLSVETKVNGEVRLREVKVGFQNPLAFFSYHCATSQHYSEIVRKALAEKPSSPSSRWQIILYL